MSTMKKGGHSEEQPPLRRTQARRLTTSIPLIYSIAQVPRGQFNLKSGTVNNAVLITRQLIEEFRYADGWIDIVRYACFEGRWIARAILEMTLSGTIPCSHLTHAVKKSRKKRGPTHQPSSGVARRLPPQLTIF